MKEEVFSAQVTGWVEREGLLHVQAKWLTGPIAGTQKLTLERTGQQLVPHEVRFGDAPVSVCLICGKFQDSIKGGLQRGDRLVERQE